MKCILSPAAIFIVFAFLSLHGYLILKQNIQTKQHKWAKMEVACIIVSLQSSSPNFSLSQWEKK